MSIPLRWALSLALLTGCGKAEPAAPSPAPAASPSAPTPAAPPASPAPSDPGPSAGAANPQTAEAALKNYIDGTRERDAAKLWTILSAKGKEQFAAMRNVLKDAPDDDLARMGVTRAEVQTLDARAFFEKFVKSAAMPTEGTLGPATDLRIEPAGDAKAKGRYKMGKASCEAELIRESDGWKVEGSSCEEGG